MLTPQVDYRLGGKPRYYLAHDGSVTMLVPDEVRKCACFVCYENKRSFKLAGTAFFISTSAQDIKEGRPVA